MRVTYPLISQPEENSLEFKSNSGWAKSLHNKLKSHIPKLSQLTKGSVKATTYGYGHFSENYYLEKNKIKYTSDLDRLLQLKKKNIDFVSNKTIAPLSLSFPLTQGDVKAKLGAPDYVFENYKVIGHEMAFYRIRSWKYRMNYQFHYYNNKLFYVNVEFSNLDFNKLNERSKVIQMIMEKYVSHTSRATLNGFPFTIADTDGNKLIITKDININMSYFSNDIQLNRELSNLLHQDIIRRMNSYDNKKNSFMKIL